MQPVLSPKTVIADRYHIQSLLGTGGMAHVYRARHVELNRDVALKVLPPEFMASDLGARFEREARAAARLDHPGCIRIVDYGRSADGGCYLAMECVEGVTLRELLVEHGAFSAARAMWVGRELLKALAHAHRHDIVHRDVKPQNVMCTTRQGVRRLVLIDFGLARLSGEPNVTASGACIGSPSYMAPERILGQRYDGRADLYSVGVLLYELLAGARPFTGASPREIGCGALMQEARNLRVIRPDIPVALAALIHRAMAKDPARRFCDAEAMMAALDDVPAAEQRRAMRIAAAHAEEESTSMMMDIGPRRSVLNRAWAWLRFGAWRWWAQAPVAADPHAHRALPPAPPARPDAPTLHALKSTLPFCGAPAPSRCHSGIVAID